MTDWSDYYCGQRVDSLARCVALRHHDARVRGSIPGLGSCNTVTLNLSNRVDTYELAPHYVYIANYVILTST